MSFLASAEAIGIPVIFSYNPATTTFAVVDFLGNGNNTTHCGSLMQASNGKLYGMTWGGGSNLRLGTSFSYEISDSLPNNRYAKLADFIGPNGSHPELTSFIEGCTINTWYRDTDGDGFGDVNDSITGCSSAPHPGYVANSSDCDDTKLLYADNDGDGFGAGSPVACGVTNNTDCNDNNANVHPITYYKDNDLDGFGDLNNTITACSSKPPAGYVANHADCNDNDATMHKPITYYKDNDHDGFGDLNNTITACSSTPPAGYVVNHGDCNDNDATAHKPVTYYKDNDLDGFGDLNNTITACSSTPPAGYVANNRDCDDNSATVHPGAPEICGNGIDDNCNGQIDEGCSPDIITVYGRSVSETTAPRNFAVKLSKSSTKTITVDYTTQDITATAGSDYIAQSGTLTFEPGIKQKLITIQVIGDRVAEPDETFEILLSNPINADIAGGTGIVTILNNDGTPASKSIAQNQDAGSTVLKDFKLSPNPANEKVNVMLTGYSGNVVIQLFDGYKRKDACRKGKVISLSKLSQQQINISGYADGVYLVTVIDEKGNRKTQKLIISR